MFWKNKKILYYDSVEDFNKDISEITNSSISIDIDYDTNEWYWADDKAKHVTALNIMNVLKEKVECTDIVVEVNGLCGTCKICMILE